MAVCGEAEAEAGEEAEGEEDEGVKECEHVTCSGCGVTLTCWERDDLGRWIMPPCPVCKLREEIAQRDARRTKA